MQGLYLTLMLKKGATSGERSLPSLEECEGWPDDHGRQLSALCQPALPHSDLTSDTLGWNEISPRSSFIAHFPRASYVLGPGVREGQKRREMQFVGHVTQDT